MKQSDLEFYADFLTMVSSDKAVKQDDIAIDRGEFIITHEGAIEVNPNLNINKEYNRAVAKSANENEDLKMYNKALEKQQDENKRDLDLYNKALNKQKNKKNFLKRKQKETGLKLA